MHPVIGVMCDLTACVFCRCCGFDEVGEFLNLSHHAGWEVICGDGFINDLFVMGGLDEFEIDFTDMSSLF